MNRLQLYKTLNHHLHLSDRRSAAWEQNKSAKYVIWGLGVFILLYLMFIAIMLSLIINDSNRITGYEFMYSIMPFIMMIDFMSRFAFQQTPSQLVKPYVLLPFSRYAAIDCFLINTATRAYNLIWFALFVPYTIMSVIFSEGVFVAIGFLLGLWLLMVINAYWYLTVRSLVTVSMAWWALPVAVYAIILSPLYIGHHAGITKMTDLYAYLGEGCSYWHPLYYLGLLAVLALLFLICRQLQYRLVWNELGKSSDNSTATASAYTRWNWLNALQIPDSWGGAYILLEIKSIIRNKNLRKAFISGTVIIVIFSLILSFSEIYDSMIMTNFWCIYCFSLYGAMILVKLMCYEGNFIDCLMVHKENIIALLRGKYYLYTALLLFPFILMLPTVFMGKCTLLMLFSYMIFTAGVGYFLFFQMAVYNKQTMPLNTKFVGKGSMENSYLQVVVEMVIFIFPIFYISILRLLLPETIAYLIVMLTGLVFMATHKLWIRNVYHRMMKRRYVNMEGLRSSR